MPNIKSAIKRMKTSEKRARGNRVVKSRIVTARRKFYEALKNGDEQNSKECISKYFSVLDKAVKRGAIKANAASRRKSRAVARMRKAQAA